MRSQFKPATVARESQFHYVVSHILDRQPVFQWFESAWFLQTLEDFEVLTQIRVLAFCILSDQVHLLLEVPPRPEICPAEAEVFGLLERSRGRGWTLVQAIRRQMEISRTAANEAYAQRVLDRAFGRMYDLGWFMKSLKQDFARWYNQINDRRGVLWESRYQAAPLEGTPPEILWLTGALDQLSLQSGVGTGPQTRHWSTFFEAFEHNTNFGAKIQKLVERQTVTPPGMISIQEALRQYARWIFARELNTPQTEAIELASPGRKTDLERGNVIFGPHRRETGATPWVRLAECLAREQLNASRLVKEVSKLLGELRGSSQGWGAGITTAGDPLDSK